MMEILLNLFIAFLFVVLTLCVWGGFQIIRRPPGYCEHVFSNWDMPNDDKQTRCCTKCNYVEKRWV